MSIHEVDSELTPVSEHRPECIWCHSEHLVSALPNEQGGIFTICRSCGIRFWRMI